MCGEAEVEAAWLHGASSEPEGPTTLSAWTWLRPADRFTGTGRHTVGRLPGLCAGPTCHPGRVVLKGELVAGPRFDLHNFVCLFAESLEQIPSLCFVRSCVRKHRNRDGKRRNLSQSLECMFERSTGFSVAHIFVEEQIRQRCDDQNVGIKYL